MFKIYACPLAIATIVSCSNADECREFPQQLQDLQIEISDLPKASIDHEFSSQAKNIINSCYRKSNLRFPDHDLVPKEIKKYNNNYFLFPYKIDGVSDIYIVFVIDKNGQVKSVFEYSLI